MSAPLMDEAEYQRLLKGGIEAPLPKFILKLESACDFNPAVAVRVADVVQKEVLRRVANGTFESPSWMKSSLIGAEVYRLGDGPIAPVTDWAATSTFLVLRREGMRSLDMTVPPPDWKGKPHV